MITFLVKFTLVTDQRSVAFMLDSRRRFKITKFSNGGWSWRRTRMKSNASQKSRILHLTRSLEYFAQA